MQTADESVVVAREVEEQPSTESACHTLIDRRESRVRARADGRHHPRQQHKDGSTEKQEHAVGGYEGQFIELSIPRRGSRTVLSEQLLRFRGPG